MDEDKGEFLRISTMFAPLSKGFSGAYNLEDDAATICPDVGYEIVVTTDTIVETIHFLGSEPPRDIAAKLIGVNFSDLAGKGASPIGYSLNLSLPPKIDDNWLEEFCHELALQQQKYHCHLIGGDSVITPKDAPICLSATAYGQVKKGKMLRRSAAIAGDLICVSGTIGDAALGLMVATGQFGIGINDGYHILADRYYRPRPRIELGQMLQGNVNASMDISDGLIADLSHMANASNLLAEINIAKIPLSNSAIDILATQPDLMSIVLTGGDDYELLFTIAADNINILNGIAKQTKVKLTVVGIMKKLNNDKILNRVRTLDRDGNIMEFSSNGFCHG